MVFCRDVRVVNKDIQDAEGRPVEFVFRATDEDIAKAPADQKRFSDFVFACTRGAMQVEWTTKVIDDTLRQEATGKGWFLQPKALGAQLDKPFADWGDGQVDLMAFLCRAAVAPDRAPLKVTAAGVAWTKWWFKGAKTLTVTGASLDLLIHEWLHHIFDSTLQETEGLTLAIMHASGDLGYGKTDLGWPSYVAHYRDRLRYYYPRDMWLRWSMKEKHDTPRGPFSDKPYAWADVKDDCWFRLPQLSVADLARLTGLEGLAVDAPKGKGYTLFKPGAGAELTSPRIAAIDDGEAALNNGLNWKRESTAVLRTPTGHWLFVKPDLVDVYVDMRKLRGESERPLPVYGWLLEGVKPLIIVKAPDDLPVPSNERSYFASSQ
ncbi:MAG: hypothetical protein NTW86_23935 [Candidatus Sumerlaeota bacterium]|nr:hypothetical protein [Candidatus Sumerlaeota bacterium]